MSNSDRCPAKYQAKAKNHGAVSVRDTPEQQASYSQGCQKEAGSKRQAWRNGTRKGEREGGRERGHAAGVAREPWEVRPCDGPQRCLVPAACTFPLSAITGHPGSATNSTAPPERAREEISARPPRQGTHQQHLALFMKFTSQLPSLIKAINTAL